VSKTVMLKNGASVIEFNYEIVNSTKEILDLWFGIEFCFALSAGDAPDRYYSFKGATPEDLRLGSMGAIKEVPSMSLVDEWLDVEVALSFDEPAAVWRFPIETVSLSEGGFERVYQGSVVFPHWHLRLETKWAGKILLELKRISKR
jgi:alpha-amylase